MLLVLDIETLPARDQRTIDHIGARIKHPGNIKKPESIEKWIKEEKPAAIEEAVSKSGLNGLYGSVLCIGYKFDDQPTQVILCDSERETLDNFSSAIKKSISSLSSVSIHGWTSEGITLVGHNHVNFDLRFLFQRFCINGVKPPHILPFHAKPWDKGVFDTMTMWAGAGNFVSLDDLCFAFGIESSKGELDGSKVAQYYAEGRIQEIKDYCAGDVEKTYEVYKRMTFGA